MVADNQDDRINEKISDEEYLALLKEEYKKEEGKILSLIAKEIKRWKNSGCSYQNIIDHILLSADEVDHNISTKTMQRFKNEKSIGKKNLEIIDKSDFLENAYKEEIKLEEEKYSYYYEELDVPESLRKSILDRSVNELTDSNIYIDSNGKFYKRKKKQIIPNDRFEAVLFNNKLNKIGRNRREEVIKKVNQAVMNVDDAGQNFASLDEFLNLHLSSGNITFSFIGLLRFLNNQESDNINYKDYSDELDKHLTNLKNSLINKQFEISSDI